MEENKEKRVLVLCAEDSDLCEKAMQYTSCNVYKPGDEVHVIHVIPRLQATTKIGGPPIDMMPYADPSMYEEMISAAEGMIGRRVLTYFQSADPVVHLIKYETDTESVGNVICKKSEELNATLVVIAKHNQSKMHELFLGSVTNFCISHCSRPCLVYH